jgi:drug/metabolite transporter (DMT)-like permease
MVLGAEICWAAGSIYARRAPLPRSALLGTGMEMVAGGAALILAGTLMGEIGQTDIGAFSTRSIVAVAYLVLFGSIVAFTAYTWLLAHVSVATVATHAYVNPIVAVGLGALFVSEPITPRTGIAAVIIIAAVVAMVSGRAGDAEEPRPSPEAAAPEPPDEAGADPAAATPHEHDGPLRAD